MSLDLIVAILKSDIMKILADILAFLCKSHIYGSIENIHTLFSTVKDLHEKFLNNKGLL